MNKFQVVPYIRHVEGRRVKFWRVVDLTGAASPTDTTHRKIIAACNTEEDAHKIAAHYNETARPAGRPRPCAMLNDSGWFLMDNF